VKKLLSFFIALWLPLLANAAMLIDDGFETCETPPGDVWRAQGNDTTTCSDAKSRCGTKSMFAQLSAGDGTPYRTQLSTYNSTHKLDYGTEYWLSGSIYIDRWDEPVPDWAILMQLHAVPGDEDWGNCVASRSLFAVTLNEGDIGLSVISTPYAGPPPVPGGSLADIVWDQPVELDRWYNWIFRVKPSETSSGILEVWLNGTKIYSKFGANVDLIDDCGEPPEPWQYLLIGVYKQLDNTATQIVYEDEIRIFEGTDGYDDVEACYLDLVSGTTPVSGESLGKGSTQAALTVSTNDDATCRFGYSPGIAWGSLTEYDTTGGTEHSHTLPVVAGGVYRICTRCYDDATEQYSEDSCTSFYNPSKPKQDAGL